MANLLKNNAYHVLGLDSTTSQKEAVKRSREIINRLKIDDIPDYPLDIGMFDHFRTETAANDAIQKLQIPKKKVKEYFFWFQISDDIDESALEAIKNKSYLSAINIWKIESDKHDVKSYPYKRNLALLYCLLLTKENNTQYLQDSLSIWKEIVESEKFWTQFTKLYILHTEQPEGGDIVITFKDGVVAELSDIYTDLHHQHKSSDYVNEFHKIFSIKGKNVEKSVLSPIYESINTYSHDLDNTKLSNDGVLDNIEAENIKGLIKSIQIEFNKLIDLNLYDDTQTKIMRDRVAESIRTIVLDLHNNLNETDKAIGLLGIALQIVGTSGYEEKIKQEIQLLEDIKSNAALLKPIDDLLSEEKYDEALNLINIDSAKYEDNLDLQESYLSKRRDCIFVMALKIWREARATFEEDRYDPAKVLYLEAGKLVYDNISLFDFNKEAIDSILIEIKSNLLKINSQNISQFDEYRGSFISLAKEKFEGKYEEGMFVILVDSCFIVCLADFLKKAKEEKLKNTIIKWVIWGGIILLIACFGK